MQGRDRQLGVFGAREVLVSGTIFSRSAATAAFESSSVPAPAIGTAMLLISFGILLFVHLVQAWARRRFGQ